MPSSSPTTASPASSRAAPARTPGLAPAERERQIVEGAIAYFAEVGFSGQTRELSTRLGITQPLLYRYFASKQALVERVYQTVFEGRWDPAWIALIEDRALPLRDRLVEFYRRYSKATYRPDWIRIYLHAGLAQPALNRRYIGRVRRELMPAYCRELRHECGLADSGTPVSEQEIEFVWSLHGGIFLSRAAPACVPHAHQGRLHDARGLCGRQFPCRRAGDLSAVGAGACAAVKHLARGREACRSCRGVSGGSDAPLSISLPHRFLRRRRYGVRRRTAGRPPAFAGLPRRARGAARARSGCCSRALARCPAAGLAPACGSGLPRGAGRRRARVRAAGAGGGLDV